MTRSAVPPPAHVRIVRAADGQLGHASHSPTLVLLIFGWSLGTGAISRASRLAALALLEVGVAFALVLAEGHAVPTDFVVLGLLPLAAFGAGSAVRRWRAAAQLERTRGMEVAAERDVHPQRAVLRERARVARELHDVVAHAVSIVSVQAGAGEALARRDPARARESVRAVLAAAHQALAELRRLLDLLSEADTAGADYGPQPGLANLDQVVANAREIGLDVELLDERTGSEPPTGVQLTAFRIVQEALTNAHKHAGRVPVLVRLAQRPGALEVEIRSDTATTATSGDSTGHGLVGMRERVRLYDGHLDAGPDQDGRWLVRAVLPTESELAG
jgi:signal transduction histidine kinase